MMLKLYTLIFKITIRCLYFAKMEGKNLDLYLNCTPIHIYS
jgi:hypothetical protein